MVAKLTAAVFMNSVSGAGTTDAGFRTEVAAMQ